MQEGIADLPRKYQKPPCPNRTKPPVDRKKSWGGRLSRQVRALPGGRKGIGRFDRDAIPQLLQAVHNLGAIPFIVVGGAQILVGLACDEHVVHNAQQAMRQGDDNLLHGHPPDRTPIERAHEGVFGMTGGPGRQG